MPRYGMERPEVGNELLELGSSLRLASLVFLGLARKGGSLVSVQIERLTALDGKGVEGCMVSCH